MDAEVNVALARYQLTLRVAKGAQRLRDYFNADLSTLVNADTANVESLVSCPLAQAFGHYDNGLDALGLDYLTAENYGFALNTCDAGLYDILTQLWKDEIRKDN